MHFTYEEKVGGSGNSSLIKEDFIFDFRFYKSSNEGHSGGHYIFYTDDKDSSTYHHAITQVLVYKGETVE